MLISVGKLSSIGEILTISDAAPAPGDRHVNVFDSLVVSVQPDGTVHDIPCRSHFASAPPASAAVCAAVATPRSAFASLSLTEVEEFEDPELLFLNLSERLHRERARPINNTSAICFM